VLKSSIISIVDDDISVRRAIANLLESAGFEAKTFASAEEFLSSDVRANTECLILDVRMPGMSGLELQSHLLTHNERIPIIFISAHGDNRVRAQGLKDGAVAFLAKPFKNQEFLDAVEAARRMERDP
jgi:FixJ family two-component response regulator